MFAALNKLLAGITLGPYERKVKRYLDEATTESVLEDLQKALAHRQRGVHRLSATFDTYCVEDSSRHGYWNAESLRKHIENTHPDVAISEEAIDLLWRCFHFHAYHPFPRDPTEGTIDFNGFQRAILLLAGQCTDILGTQEMDYYWRFDDDFFRSASFQRLFRSIGIMETEDSTQSPGISKYVLNDLMDVLAMTQPQVVCFAPSPDQLESAAHKLLGEGLTQNQYRVTRRDLSSFISLLLRLKLKTSKWGSPWFYTGTFDNADPADTELADILVNGLGGNQKEDILTPDQIHRAINLLPNLELRSHQLWAVLFQSPSISIDEVSSHAPEAINDHILGAISLFVPQPVVSSLSEMTIITQDTRIALEKPTQPVEKSNDLTMSRLLKSLATDRNPHLLLLTGDKTATTSFPVMGAYFPGPLWVKAEGNEDKRKFKTGTSHLLFQLKPEFRLLRWTCPNVPLTDLITLNDGSLLETIVASDSATPELSIPYRIGDPDLKCASLLIDPEMRSATMTSASTNAGDGEVVWYKDACIDGEYGDKSLSKDWEVTFKLDRFDIFSVSGGLDEALSEGRITSAKDYARHVQEMAEPGIKGDVLAKRIQGFGFTDL